jgi:hypothetical protein
MPPRKSKREMWIRKHEQQSALKGGALVSEPEILK